MTDLRTCTKCGEEKPATLEYFHKSGTKGFLRRACKPCCRAARALYRVTGKDVVDRANARYRERNADLLSEKQSAYYAANRTDARERNREAQLKHIYGITMAQYCDILESQGGVCAICSAESADFLCVDHDHETNEIRGLLCRLCNSALGRFGDNEAGVMRAIEYLRTARERISAAIPEGTRRPVRRRANA